MSHGPNVVEIVSKVIVWNEDDKLLVLRRSKTDPRRPLTWDFPGGVVEPNEDPRTAARRETSEESGIEVQDLLAVDVVSASGNGYLTIIFEAKAPNQTVTLSWEHDKYTWVTAAELEELDIPQKYKQAVKIATHR